MPPLPSTSGPLMLRQASRALAEYALGRHAELDPDVFERYGEGSRALWRHDTQARLATLAVALEVGRPELFAEFVRWQAQGYEPRGLDAGDLRRHLECLAQVLRAELPGAAGRTAADAVDAARAGLDQPGARPGGLAADGPHRELARRVLLALLEWKGEQAQALVLEAVRAGVGLDALYQHVFIPVEVEVGRMWHAGELGVAEEHYVTGTLQSLMARLTAERAPAAEDAPTVVVSAVSGDTHDMAVRMLADHFAWSGWRVRSLGAATPPEDVVEAVAQSGAQVVALSATLVSHLSSVLETVQALRADERTRAVKVLVGGQPFNAAPDLWRELGADGWAADLPGAVRRAAELIA